MSHIHTHNCDCAEASKGPGDLYSLFQNVAMDSVRVLNEDVAESGKKIIKPFDQRLNDDTVVTSSCDGELIFHIPFTSCVRLKTIVVKAHKGPGSSSPSKMKLWVNREDIDFSSHEDIKCTQELPVHIDALGELQIQVKQALFQNTTHLTIFFSKPHENSDDEISMSYLGLFGQPTSHKRQAVNVVYEAKANPKDHKADASSEMTKSTIS